MKISLVINSHNPNPDYLKEAIDSAIGFDEVILYLNNQNPTSISLPKFNQKILLLADGKDRNCADGFNHVISWANNDWILPFCDNDSFITENLNDLLKYMRENEQLLINCDIIYYPCLINGKDEWGDEIVTLDSLKEGNQIPFSCIYRKKVWEEIKGYVNLPFNDWLFWLSAKKKNYNFYYHKLPIYNFRQEENSLSFREFNAQKFEETKKILLNELEKI